MVRVLIVDDEPIMRSYLKEALSRNGYSVSAAENGKKALRMLVEESFDVILTDLKMEEMGGIELLKKAKEIAPSTAVIVMTAYGTVENAVEAMKLGASNYLLKPFALDALEMVMEKAEMEGKLKEENSYLRKENHTSQVVAESSSMKKILKEAKKIAESSSSVFLHGESGTGKEVVAHYIHTHSPRHHKPYIRVNCAAISESLLESEFFGHEKGAFTGALSKKMGRFELAHEGTLFLDEVTEIPLTLQPKLLRAIQEREFDRVGGTKSVSVNIRFISSSNRNLKEAIKNQQFREDLFFRLNVIPLYLPPLRERVEDILPLAQYFLEKHLQTNHKKGKGFSEKALERLQGYAWPGNVRELSNVVERAVVLSSSPTISEESLLFNV